MSGSDIREADGLVDGQEEESAAADGADGADEAGDAGGADRGGGRLDRRVALVCALVVLLGAVGAGYATWQSSRAEAVQQARTAATETAAKSVPQLLSYDGKDALAGLDDDLGKLTGSFRNDFENLMRSQIVPAAETDGISSKAEVVATSVVSAKADRVVLLLFVNVTTSSTAAKQPQIRGSRIEVTLVEKDGDWLVSELQPL